MYVKADATKLRIVNKANLFSEQIIQESQTVKANEPATSIYAFKLQPVKVISSLIINHYVFDSPNYNNATSYNLPVRNVTLVTEGPKANRMKAIVCTRSRLAH